MFLAGCREAAEDLLAFRLVTDLRTSGGNVLEAPRKVSVAKAKQTLLQLRSVITSGTCVIFLHAKPLPSALCHALQNVADSNRIQLGC